MKKDVIIVSVWGDARSEISRWRSRSREQAACLIINHFVSMAATLVSLVLGAPARAIGPPAWCGVDAPQTSNIPARWARDNANFIANPASVDPAAASVSKILEEASAPAWSGISAPQKSSIPVPGHWTRENTGYVAAKALDPIEEAYFVHFAGEVHPGRPLQHLLLTITTSLAFQSACAKMQLVIRSLGRSSRVCYLTVRNAARNIFWLASLPFLALDRTPNRWARDPKQWRRSTTWQSQRTWVSGPRGRAAPTKGYSATDFLESAW